MGLKVRREFRAAHRGERREKLRDALQDDLPELSLLVFLLRVVPVVGVVGALLRPVLLVVALLARRAALQHGEAVVAEALEVSGGGEVPNPAPPKAATDLITSAALSIAAATASLSSSSSAARYVALRDASTIGKASALGGGAAFRAHCAILANAWCACDRTIWCM